MSSKYDEMVAADREAWMENAQRLESAINMVGSTLEWDNYAAFALGNAPITAQYISELFLRELGRHSVDLNGQVARDGQKAYELASIRLVAMLSRFVAGIVNRSDESSR